LLSLFKLINRLLSQTDALHSVLLELLQSDARGGIMRIITAGYVRTFLHYFNRHSASSIVAANLTCQATRVKLSKRVEAMLDKFEAWIEGEEHARMRQSLGVLIVVAVAPQPAAPATAASAPSEVV
jgi:hypothetical protein